MIHDIASTLAPMRFDRLSAPARDKLLLCLLRSRLCLDQGLGHPLSEWFLRVWQYKQKQYLKPEHRSEVANLWL